MSRGLSTRISQYATFVVARSLIFIVGVLPEHSALRLGPKIGSFLHALDRKHRRRARRNLSEAEPPVCPDEEIPDLVRRMYRHFGISLVELFRLPKVISGGKYSERVKLEGFGLVEQVLERGRGAILITGHLGNWEVGGIATAVADYPIHTLTRPLDNVPFNAFLNRRYRKMGGQAMIARDGALPAMIKVLKQNRILVLQADRNVRKGGVPAAFFGRPATTYRSPALLSLRYDAPIVLLDVFRENGVTILRMGDPIYPANHRESPEPIVSITQEFTSTLERYIRRNPEQWTWGHNRWKTSDRASQKAP